MEPLLLAKELVESSRHFDKAFLCNSGTEANEAALKFAKKVALIVAIKEAGVEAKGAAMPAWTPRCKGSPPTSCATEGGLCACWPQVANNDIARGVKNEVIAFKGAFHGRTMGALACTHKPAIRQPFGPFPADVRFARFNNIDGAWREDTQTQSQLWARDVLTPSPREPPPPAASPRQMSFFSGRTRWAQ
jgi:4-aminobutyrate aminotransferase-like enzyme